MARKLSTFWVFIAASVIVLLSGKNVSAQQPVHWFDRNTIRGLNSVLALEQQDEVWWGGPTRTSYFLIANDIVRFTMNVNAQTPPPNILSAPYIAVSQEAMTGTAAALGYTLNVNKTGQGLWRLDQIHVVDPVTGNPRWIPGTTTQIVLANQSNLWATTSNQFRVNEGTLELMRGSSITLQGTAAQTSFTMGAGTTLNARGSWLYSTINEVGEYPDVLPGTPAGPIAFNVINAPTVLENNVSLGFDLTDYTDNQSNYSDYIDGQLISYPILDFQGGLTLSDPTNTGNLNLLGFSTTPTTLNGITVNLLRYSYTVAAPAAPPEGDPPLPAYTAPPIRAYYTDINGRTEIPPTPVGPLFYPGNFEVLVRGESWDAVKIASNGRLQGTVTQNAPAENTGSQEINIRINNFKSYSGTVTWNGNAGDNVWNATSANWGGNIADFGLTNTFLHGDTVLFGATGAGAITVQNGGVQIENRAITNLPLQGVTAGMIVYAGLYDFTNAQNSLIGIDGPGSVLITSLAGNPNKTSVTFHSANSYWGGTVVDDAFLILENSGGAGTNGLQLKNNAELTFATNVPGDNFFNDISTESGTDIFKDNTNTLTVYGMVMGAADTTVHAGTLRKNIGQGILTVFKDAVYDTLDSDRNIAGLSDRLLSDPAPEPASGIARVDMRNYKLYIDVAPGREFTFSGRIEGAGAAVTKAGLGTQTFAYRDNSYSGGTTITKGTLVGQDVLNSDIVFHPFGTGMIQIDKDALLQFDLRRSVLDTNPDLYVASLDNTITGAGDLEMKADEIYIDLNTLDPTEKGNEILYLTANDSSYTGKTLINGGKLRIQSILSTGKTSEVAIANGSALQFNEMVDSGRTSPYNRIITGAGGVEVLNETSVYVQSFNDDTATVRNSDYTGKTFVYQNADLHILDTQATGKTDVVSLEAPTSNLTFNFFSKPDRNNPIPGLRNREIEQVYDRFITGAGNIVAAGDINSVTVLDRELRALLRSNNFTGTTTVQSGTLKLNYDDATGARDALGEQRVTINQTGILELGFDGHYYKGIKGQGILAKSGEGTVSYLEGQSTYTGGTYLYSGTLSYSDLDENTPGNLGSGGVEFQRGGGILQNRNIVNSFEQKITIYGGSTATFDTQADLTILGTGGIVINHYTVSPDDPYYNAEDQKSHLAKIGPGTMTIDTVAAWTGSTRIDEGILVNNIPTDTEMTINAPGRYRTGNADRQVSLLLGDGTVETAPGKNFIINNAVEDIFNGVIIGDGNLVKRNKGTLQLTGDNIFTGSTIIEEGIVIGNIGSGANLTIYAPGTYLAGGANRLVSSLQGGGMMDMQGRSLTIKQTRTNIQPAFSGVITNGDRLIKTGKGSQTLGGLNYRFNSDIAIEEGTLRVGGLGSTTATQMTTEKYLNVKEGATLWLDRRATINVKENVNIDGTLVVSVEKNSIWANSFTLGGHAALDVRGIGSNDSLMLLFHSNTPIEDNFANILVGGEDSGVDYLYLGVSKSDNKKELYVGQTLSWFAPKDAHGSFTLTNPDNEFNIGVELKNVTGTFDNSVWDGKTLTKKGLGTLILSEKNSYTGPTNVVEGTLKLTHEQATAGSEKIALQTNQTRLALDFNSFNKEDGSWSKGLITPITGAGEVYKAGYNTMAVLGGTNTYTGATNVEQGVLLADGSIKSHVWVREDAGFGGRGTVNNTVSFEKGSHYYWRFGATQDTFDTLTVTDNVYIGEDVMFKPVTTVKKDLLSNFENWSVLKYGSGLYGRFAGIDASSNPFYDFDLDYDQHGVVKLSGHLRNRPRALSDIVPTSLMLAETKMYRTAFQQITREWQSECSQHSHALPQTRGQVRHPTRSAWMSFVGRGEEFESTYFKEDYKLQSYGVQTGISLLSNCTQNFGLMFGREEGKLSNNGDQVKDEDYYLGFYFAQKFFDEHDIRVYIGGGWQSNDLIRTSNGYRYTSNYNGNTFNLNAEVGRRFFGQNNWSVRLLGGADIEVRRLGGSLERSIDLETSNEYRRYQGSDLSRFFVRTGIEANKTWRRIDFRTGTQLGWNFGDTRPKTTIYYPALDDSYTRADVLGEGAHLGRFEWWLNVGMSWYLSDRRNTFFFLDYNGDVYLDRDGDTSAGTGTLGFCWRF